MFGKRRGDAKKRKRGRFLAERTACLQHVDRSVLSSFELSLTTDPTENVRRF